MTDPRLYPLQAEIARQLREQGFVETAKDGPLCDSIASPKETEHRQVDLRISLLVATASRSASSRPRRGSGGR
jgi:hypothetical protein